MMKGLKVWKEGRRLLMSGNASPLPLELQSFTAGQPESMRSVEKEGLECSR